MQQYRFLLLRKLAHSAFVDSITPNRRDAPESFVVTVDCTLDKASLLIMPTMILNCENIWAILEQMPFQSRMLTSGHPRHDAVKSLQLPRGPYLISSKVGVTSLHGQSEWTFPKADCQPPFGGDCRI
jgi:hypothetical protein